MTIILIVGSILQALHVNLFTLCFRDKFKERAYHEERDVGFAASLASAMAILIMLAGVQLAVLPRTIILVILFLAAFIWIAALLILVLGAKLHVSLSLIESQYRKRC